MFDFHEKRKLKSLVFSKITIGVLLIASGLLSLSVYERYEKERETAHKRAERTADLLELEARAAALEEKVAYVQSARGIEEEVRDRYGALKAGERAVIVMERPGKQHASSTYAPPTASEEAPSFFDWLFFWR